MHIVLDARFFAQTAGGISRYTRALIREVTASQTGHHFTVLIPTVNTAEWQAFAKQAALDPKQWRMQPIDIPYYSYAEQTRLPGLLNRLEPDLVHFTNFNHPVLWNQPFVVTMHDLTILNYPVGRRQRSALAQAAFRWTIRHGLNSAKRVITVSQTSRDDLVDHFGGQPDRLAVVYEGVDAAYQPVNLPLRGRAQTYLKERYGIRPPFLLFVSQWRPHKGILTLIEAYERLRLADPRRQVQLVVTGRANDHFPEIPARMEASSFAADIIRPGFVDEIDLPKLYQAAQAFVFPSLYEGFGLTPLEAMACGTPVLASDASCLPEILGDAALLLPPTNPALWAKAMARVLDDAAVRRQLHAAGLAQARHYSWRQMAEDTLAIYEKAG